MFQFVVFVFTVIFTCSDGSKKGGCQGHFFPRRATEIIHNITKLMRGNFKRAYRKKQMAKQDGRGLGIINKTVQ